MRPCIIRVLFDYKLPHGQEASLSLNFFLSQNAMGGSPYRLLYERFTEHKVRPKTITEATEIIMSNPNYALIGSYNLLLYVTQKRCGQLMLSDRARVQNSVGFAVLPNVNFSYQLDK